MKLTNKLKRKLKKRFSYACFGIVMVCMSMLTMEMTEVASFGVVDKIKYYSQGGESKSSKEEIILSSETNIKGIKINRIGI